MRGNFDNTGKLVRFMLRREAKISTIWIVAIAVFCAILVPMMDGMFSEEAREGFAITINNPVMVMMMGPVYGADNYTSGAMYSNMMLVWVMITVAIMNVFLIVRHTRADEEKGRAEVVRSLPVGRMANLNAAMITAVIVNVILGLLIGLGLTAAGSNVDGYTFAGSLLFGMTICAAGIVFAAITALFAQLSSNKGGALGLSFLALGIAYFIRGAGDMQENELVSCISPLGLAQRAQVYVENNWLPVFLLLLIGAVITAVAYKLNSVRDLEQGFIPARPGKKEASKTLRTPFGFALRLLRPLIIIWIIVMFTLGASYASVVGDISSFVGDSPQYLEVLGVPSAIVATLSGEEKEEIVQIYFMSFVTTMMALVCIVPLLNTTLRPRNEEKDGRAELVLSRSVPRFKYLAGFALIAFALSVLLQFITAYGLYMTAEAMLEGNNPFTFEVVMEAFLIYLPALWALIGLTVLLIGALPKATGAIWGMFAFVFVVSFMGELIGLPEWLMSISPMYHIPNTMLGADTDFVPLAILSAVAVVFTASGLVFYHKRETVTI